MKIPYVKVYTADLLAKSRRLTPEQIGRAILGICEQAFENATDYAPQTDAEKALFDMLIGWKNESVSALKQKKKAGRLGAQKTNEKRKLSDGGTAALSAVGTSKRHTETDTDTETETDINKQHTAAPAAGQVNQKPKLNKLQEFSNAVLAEFEELETKDQIAVWFKRNCRCLSDILKFCNGEIPVGLAVIRVCVERLEKAGLSGGYEAVCRNLPEYYHEAKKRLEGGVYAK
ncbi:MAG: hypothetical protein PUC11_05980 [Elusimicrobia bacterium]|nr:hypothetical protein [Elusimicrobiota bacterium]